MRLVKLAKQLGSPTRIVAAEELVYPDFRIRLPGFPSEEYERRWLELFHNAGGHHERITRIGKHGGFMWAYYRGQRGQNLVFQNAVYKGSPVMDMWGPAAATSPDVSHEVFTVDAVDAGIFNTTTAATVAVGGGMPHAQKLQLVDELVFAASPDSWSWQHFNDRVVNMLLQARHMLTAGQSNAVFGRKVPANKVHRHVLSALLRQQPNASLGSMLVSGQLLFARRFVHTLRTPLIHPWFNEHLHKVLQLPHKPLNQRKLVLYMSRAQKGSGARNGGRNVVNEGELFDSIRNMLEQRGEGEQLTQWNTQVHAANWQNFSKTMASVRAIVGPHGGALYAAPNTLLVESLPSTRFGVLFWEMLSIMRLNVHVLITETVNAQHDMSADVPSIVRTLENELGKEREGATYLEHVYPWALAAASSLGTPISVA
ncbi:hypothetical protein FOA52_003927 [Chlamydomonas sp. UWO 241]|nr:hypothetical protein FOA52_003927 [Chlamydomonas sp. UWO 241]